MNLIDGTIASASEAGHDAHFAAPLDPAARERFLREWPNRLAFKHAHSRQNAESGWGRRLGVVVDGGRAAFVGPRGLVRQPLTTCTTAWWIG